MRINKGASALPIVLLISGVVMEIVLASLVTAKLFSNSILSEQLSIEASEAAEAGAQDAILRVTRFIDCPTGAGGYCPDSYELTLSQDPARTACINIGDIASGKMTIYSRGLAFNREKTIEAILGVSVTDARVDLQSFKEVETPDTFDDTNC